MAEAVIVATARTPMGRYGGQLKDVRPDDLAAIALKEAVNRAGVDPKDVDDVILGCANQAGEDNRNVARMALLLAGFPVEVPGQTVNRLCGSGLQAVVSAAHAVRAGEGDGFIAGGVESMTRAPYVMLKSDTPWSRSAPSVADTTVGWRFVNPLMPAPWTVPLGETAEMVAERSGVTREAQDAFALQSQQRARRAIAERVFDDEIVPVEIRARDGTVRRVSEDEHPRPDTT